MSAVFSVTSGLVFLVELFPKKTKTKKKHSSVLALSELSLMVMAIHFPNNCDNNAVKGGHFEYVLYVA